jgi:tRNA-guanine family transglycosylase
MLNDLLVKGKVVKLPIFCPDATRGVVRGLDSRDLEQLGVRGLIVNTWHLHQDWGAAKMKTIGGI